MRAALIQMPVTEDKRENLETACRRLREVKARGADVAVLPEMFWRTRHTASSFPSSD